jgi:hypothetical protein
MIASIATTTSPIIASVLTEAMTMLAPETSLEVRLVLTMPDFQSGFSIPLTEITPVINSDTIIAEAHIDHNVRLLLTLTGLLDKSGVEFQIRQASIKIAPLEETAFAEFVATTLNALLTLTEEVHLDMPEVGLNLHLRFGLPLLEISKMLQARQTAYRLMVIEQATGNQLLLPSRFSVDEMERIIFTYQAIVERSFDWQFGTQVLFVSANREGLDEIMRIQQSASWTFTVDRETVLTLDKPIFLGNAKVTVNDAFIENFNEVITEIETFDNHPVRVVIGSTSNRARFDLPDAPHLTDISWDSKIQRLIDLESQLDAHLVSRYHALAAATLEGLTEEEKATITRRPELNEEAFVIEDWNKENL